MKSRIRLRSLRLSLMALSCLLGLQMGCSDSQDDGGPGRPNISVANDTGFGDDNDDAGDVGDAGGDVDENDVDDADAGDDAGDDVGDVDDASGVDACIPQSDAELCDENAATCGELVVTDRCGVERTVATCGECAGSDLCGDIAPNQCGCALPSVAELCAEHALECGETQVVDRCGAERILDCGEESLVCSGEFDTCGGGGTDNICGCTPTTCEENGTLCGQIDDGCGGVLTCNYFCVEDLSLGANHACALGSGKAKCWGSNSNGKLGDNSTTQRKEPVDVVGLDIATDIASGTEHTCALTHDGKVICWGDNSQGQLGIGTTVDANKPGHPAITADATQVVTGAQHTCALVNGGVFCWGASGEGQIGNEAITLGSIIGVPMEVTGLSSGVTQLAAGSHHNCALRDDGSVQCWGRGRYGQLANLDLASVLGNQAVGHDEEITLNEYTLEKTPWTIPGLPAGVAQIVAGDDFSCARTSAGDLWCWGAMNFQNRVCEVFDKRADDCAIFPVVGQGEPVVRYKTTPRSASCPSATCSERGLGCGADDKCHWVEFPINKVYIDRVARRPLQISDTRTNLEVAAGSNHICVRSDEAGATQTNIFCMGRNFSGQLGDGTTNPWTAPRAVHADSDGDAVRAESTTVPHALSLGDNFSCAIVEDNNMQCWGSNQNGQIGNEALLRDESLKPFDVKITY